MVRMINNHADNSFTPTKAHPGQALNEKKYPEVASIPSTGSIVEGKVVAKDRSSLFIDLGPQGTGIIYGKEFYQAKDIIKGLNMGDTVFAKIIDSENEDGYTELSLKDAAQEINWQKLREMKDKEEIIKVKITGVNKGGLLTNISGIAAFLPVSQLSGENYPRVEDGDKQKILKELQKFIGKILEVKILDLMAQEDKLILSEKAKTEQLVKEILKNYKKGDVVEGQITGIADFGAFIKFPIDAVRTVGNVQDFQDEQVEQASPKVSDRTVKTTKNADGVEGLIHISELDWQLVQNPNEIVKVGQTVKAKIIDINNNQVFLSLKSLKENPWEEVEKKYKKGDVIKGKVTSFSPFGAFVEVLPQIRGLCHISEFTSQKEMQESLKAGETYDFTVLLVDPKEHRMSLKLIT